MNSNRDTPAERAMPFNWLRNNSSPSAATMPVQESAPAASVQSCSESPPMARTRSQTRPEARSRESPQREANQPSSSTPAATVTTVTDPVVTATPPASVSEPTPTPSVPPPAPPAPPSREPSPAADNNMTEFDRSQPIYCRELDKHYPAPSRFDDASPLEWNRDNLELWGAAPWLDRDAIDIDWLMESYADDDECLPGSIPLSALGSFSWRRQYSISDADLHVPVSRTLKGVRGDFAYQVYTSLEKLLTFQDIPDDLRCDLFAYRTRGEIGYCRAASQLTDAQLESWRNRCEPDQAALLYDRPQLVREFRYLRKDSEYWTESIRNERRVRASLDLIIPHHCATQATMRYNRRLMAFCQATDLWKLVEVPRGCRAELPATFAYKMEELLDPSSGWWMVAFNGFAAKVAAFVIQDAYDKFRLWALPPRMIRIIRGLDLSRVLGTEDNQAELRGMLDIIEGTRFEELPSSWTSRGGNLRGNRRTAGLCLGRRGGGADFVYYDPWAKRKLSEDEYILKIRSPRRVMPSGHPVGHDFETEFVAPANGDADAASSAWFGGQSPPRSPAPAATATAHANEDEEEPTPEARQRFVDMTNRYFGFTSGGPGSSAAGGAGPSTMAGTLGSASAYAGSMNYGAAQMPNYFGMQPYRMHYPMAYPPATNAGYAPSAPGYGLPGSAPTPNQNVLPSSSDEAELVAIRSFLRSLGVDEATLRGGLEELRGFVRGRMH